MKVYIGPFSSFIGPYQIADTLKVFGVSEEKCDAIGEKLANTWVSTFCNWVESKRKRTVKVKIHAYDTWNIDSTLSYIVLPMLIKLQKEKHGAPLVDDVDVPENLRSSNAPPKENDYDCDEFHFKRWDWVLDEMIWAFEQIHPDNDWENQYHSGEIDMQFKPCDPPEHLQDDETKDELFEMISGPNDTHKFDVEGYKKHDARIDNGLRLFGVYFRALWD